MLRVRVCKRCESSFEYESRRGRAPDSCPKCQTPLRTCRGCGSDFRWNRTGGGLYCTNACSNRTARRRQSTKVLRDCETCGKQTSNQRCCSKECLNQWQTGRKISTAGVLCTVCRRRKVDYDFIFCSPECSEVALRLNSRVGEQGYLILVGLSGHPLVATGSYSTFTGLHRLVLWQKLGCESIDCVHDCELCSKPLTWGGIDGICTDHIDRDVRNNNPSNLRVLCQVCNLMRDREE